MDPQLIRLYEFTLRFCESLMRDIAEDEIHIQPAPRVNTPAWLVGHLAICTDSALRLVGAPPRLPADWRDLFGPGTTPDGVGESCPSKDELMLALREGHAAVAEALPSVDAETLAGPNPLESPTLKKAFPTVADLLAHLLTTHEAMHLGHLSSWRRQMGRPPLF